MKSLEKYGVKFVRRSGDWKFYRKELNGIRMDFDLCPTCNLLTVSDRIADADYHRNIIKNFKYKNESEVVKLLFKFPWVVIFLKRK